MRADFPFRPASLPFFYGWVILGASTLGTVMSVPGQTIGVSFFTDHVLEATGLTLEQAVSRNTLMPATVHGLDDRGVLRVGAAADVLVIDPERLAAGNSHTVADFPADTERYIVRAEGYRAVIVNGQVLLEDNVHTGALPGEVIRLA